MVWLAFMQQHVRFIDLLRCFAACAVIMIHVLGPYRMQYGELPFAQWASAITVNGLSRWAVPVFILISGALMLSDKRPFELGYYLRRRLAKVLLPFVVWSAVYAFLTPNPVSTLQNMPWHATYYHLGFFYYFIPLYFVIPFLRPLVQSLDRVGVLGITAIWLGLSILYLLDTRGWWTANIIMFSGFLPLGYLLYRNEFLPKQLTMLLGLGALIMTPIMVLQRSLEADSYSAGLWLSYKTINVVLAAALVFEFGRWLADRLPESAWRWVSLISRHSLGIYLLHPLFLWPVRRFDLYAGHPLLMILLWTIVSGALALGVSIVLHRSKYTAWLTP